MTLHEAIQIVLKETSREMTTIEIAKELNKRNLYSKKNSSQITDFQVHRSTKNYPKVFTRNRNKVGLIKVSKKVDHKIKINVNDKVVETLSDILPEIPRLEILFIAKTPAPISVKAGHYFQGTQGRMLWNKLASYKILNVNNGEYEDDHLLEKLYGITDIVKVPRGYGNEPSAEEYREGLKRILDLIKLYKPKVICFVYKKVLDQIIKLIFHRNQKSNYGFNPDLEKDFETKIFVFPMPGTSCDTELADSSMLKLKNYLKK